MKQKRRYSIACFFPQSRDATSYWRGVGPLAHLSRHFLGDVQFTMMPKSIDWDDLAWFDMAFIQRPMSDNSNRLCDLLEEMNKKLWLDFDDDLLNVPYGNPAFEIFSKKETKQNVERLIRRANLITVSTPKLRELYSKFNQNIRLVPNAWNFEEFPDSKRIKNVMPVFNKMIVWRGSATHDNDLMLHLEPLIKTMVKHKEWKITFVGSPIKFAIHELTKAIGNRCRVLPPLPIHQFVHFLNHLQPAVGIVPLEICSFNESKSNIAWQEMTYGSSVVVAPNTVEWHRPGVQNYISPGNFGDVLDDTLTQKAEKLSELNETSWQDIKDNWNLDRINIRRAQVVGDLLELTDGAIGPENRLGEGVEIPVIRDAHVETSCAVGAP